MDGDGEAVSREGGATLAHLQQEDASLMTLLRLLLSFSTLPHIVLIIVLSSLLQLAAVNAFEAMSAFGFLALSSGYFLTGLLANRPTVQGWIQLPKDASSDRSKVQRMVFSFRICMFPLILSAVMFGLLVLLVGEQGALADLSSLIPWVLSSCFVLWAIVQGRGFGRWLSSVSASKLPESAAREPGLSTRSMAMPLAIILSLTALLLYVFEMMADSSSTPGEVVLRNIGFLVLVSVVFALAWRRSHGARLEASARTDFHRFAGRWFLLSQFMITWHLLTVWRHQFISPGSAVLFLEEFLLMAFTVLMAIWGLTSRSFRSPLKLVRTENALPMGLAFGYAYAGSVAMLTTVLDDVRAVMMAGHLVVALTFFWIQPRILRQTMGQTESQEHIKRVVEAATIAPEPPVVSAPADDDGSQNEENADASEPVSAPDGAAEDIGRDVDWKEPDVLATEVAWDDDIEVVD